MKTLIPAVLRNPSCILSLALLPVLGAWAASPGEKLRNEKVAVIEQTLAPGEVLSTPADHAGVVVYLEPGLVELASSEGKPQMEAVSRGDVLFRPPQAGALKNAGTTALKLAWTEYLGNGGSETWGTAGLAPNYKLLIENQYGRVYDIQMKAGHYEPPHTHHNRVVICLSGAKLEHVMVDGRKEPATLKTGEIAWRRGVTHIGHNLGKTDLWVIAIEPK